MVYLPAEDSNLEAGGLHIASPRPVWNESLRPKAKKVGAQGAAASVARGSRYGASEFDRQDDYRQDVFVSTSTRPVDAGVGTGHLEEEV
jgi:hypothetical protein